MALCCPALLSLRWNRSYSAVSGVAELLRDAGRFAPRHWTNWSEKPVDLERETHLDSCTHFVSKLGVF